MTQNNETQELHRLLEDADSTRAALAEVKYRKAQMVHQFDEMIATLESKLAGLIQNDAVTSNKASRLM